MDSYWIMGFISQIHMHINNELLYGPTYHTWVDQS